MDERLVELPLERIRREPTHPDPTRWLIENMAEVGLRQPITVSAGKDGTYEIRAGRRRVKAARQLGWATIRAFLVPAGEDACPMELEAILANIQCEELRQLYQAMHARGLIAGQGYTQTELARQMGVSQPALCRMLQVVECEELVRAVKEEGLAFSAAKALVSLPAAERRALLAELRGQAAETGKFPTVREIEAAVRRRQGRGPELALSTDDLPVVLATAHSLKVPIALTVVEGRSRRIEVRVELTERLEERLRERPAANAAGSPAEGPAPEPAEPPAPNYSTGNKSTPGAPAPDGGRSVPWKGPAPPPREPPRSLYSPWKDFSPAPPPEEGEQEEEGALRTEPRTHEERIQ